MNKKESKYMTVLGYARTSTFLQETSIAAQQEKIKAHCKYKEWNLKKIFIDEGKSGSNLDREAWKELMQEIETGKYQGIVFTSLDRVARSLSDLLKVIADMEKLNVSFCSINENISTEGATGRLMIQVLGAFAEFERNVIRQRLFEGLERAKNKKGFRMGRIPKQLNKEKVIELYNLHVPIRIIAEQMNTTRTTIYKNLKLWGLYKTKEL